MSQGKVNVPVLVGGIAVVVALVGVLASGFGKDPHALPVTMEGKAAPRFSLTPMGGGAAVSSESLLGKVAVLNFWASWCSPCAQEHPTLLQASRVYSDVAFYGVLYGDTEENAKVFLANRGQAYPTLLDLTQATTIDFGVAGVPETFVLDKTGKIAHKFAGPVTLDQLVQTLEPLR